ncbi:MAG: radical SAM family heme chaperone HemW [Roseburia sp.]
MGKKEMELYVHIPFCVKKCNYCDFLSFSADEDTQRAYVQALLRELEFYGNKYGDRPVPTVYIGGGTPSWLREEYIEAVMEQIHRSFSLTGDAEVSIECNPGTVTDHKFSVYRRCGINRISIGLQSANNEELKLLGRIHTYEQFLKTYDLARRNGFDNINIDLMNSLPGQTVEAYYESLQQVIRLRPEHISAYSLIIEKGTPFYENYRFDVVRQEAGMKTEMLPSEEEVCQMLKLTRKALTTMGYEHYEVSNFARPGYACRHNIGYWKRVDYLGAGLGAASLLDNVRYSNTRELYEYLSGTQQLREGIWENELPDGSREELFATNLHCSAENISRNARMEEFMFLGLRMIRGISRQEFQDAFGIPIEAVYQEPMDRLRQQGLLEKREGRVYLTERGQDLGNYALSQFLFS